MFGDQQLRRRRTPAHTADEKKGEADKLKETPPPKKDWVPESVEPPFVSSATAIEPANTNDVTTFASIQYTVAKWAILRLTAFIYLVAFLGAFYQNEGLMGSHGLQPAEHFMERLKPKYVDITQDSYDYAGAWKGFQKYPTIFWFVLLNDDNMDLVARMGITLSVLALLGVNSWMIQFLLWLLDFSIVTISSGTSFYSYGWESQLLETGFLAIFLCALPRFDKESLRLKLFEYGQAEPPSPVILWLFSWLCFRISMGAGLIKIRGSSCWTEKTCLFYHFETQPLPSPLSFFFHFLPKSTLSQGVDLDLIVQVYTSWFVLIPVAFWSFPQRRRRSGIWSTIHFLASRAGLFVARLGGIVQAGFMVNIALSGNFSYLNHLTIIPALATIDDACWPRFLQSRNHHSGRVIPADDTAENKKSSSNTAITFNLLSRRILIDWPLMLWILYLSWPVVANLLQLDGRRQVMNSSFDSFRLVNTYGAFGSVGHARYEPIVQIRGSTGTNKPNHNNFTTTNLDEWVELEFPCKPGTVTRRPCFCAPYHYRIDWNIWFIGFKPHKSYLNRREVWLYEMLSKMLQTPQNDASTKRPWLALLDVSSALYLNETYYRMGEAPLYAKVDMYHYQMAAPLFTILRQYLQTMMGTRKEPIVWWNRTFEENLIPPVQLDRVKGKLQYARE